MKKVEYISKYGENAYKEYLRRCKEYRDAHKDKIAKYYAIHKDKISERMKKYQQEHKEYFAEYQKKYYKDNAERIAEYKNETKFGRASMLISSYRKSDKKYNRGECTLTHEWMIDNIFGATCFYCGCSDWHQLGADRIDNSLPHTPDNVVCSCWNCNNERKKMDFKLFCEKKKNTEH